MTTEEIKNIVSELRTQPGVEKSKPVLLIHPDDYKNLPFVKDLKPCV